MYTKWLLRLLALVVLVLFIYQFAGVIERMDWAAFGRALGRPGNWRYLALALALMPLNWWLEARKWHLLLTAFADWSFTRVLRATLAGVSVSAATPNRIGEIGGRMLVARREEWPAVMASSLLGGACQWVAFLLLAWPALIYTLGQLHELTGALPLKWLLPAGPLVLLILGTAGKSLLLRVLRWGGRKLGKDVMVLADSLAKVNFRLMSVASAYACLRFCVYCTQLYLLLWFFGLELNWWSGLAGIMAIYLVQAGIPLPPGVNFVTRTELGLLLWQTEASDTVAVLAAYTALFCVNVLLPSLPGYWLIVRKRKE